MREVESTLSEEKKRVRTVCRTLDNEVVKFQEGKALFEEKMQELVGNLQTEANQRARLEEDLRLNAIQKELWRSHERQLEAKLAEAESTIQQYREHQGYRCAVCYESMCDTVTMCGHQFCWECFVSWHQEQSKDLVVSYSCPLCRIVIGRRGDSVSSMAIKLYKN